MSDLREIRDQLGELANSIASTPLAGPDTIRDWLCDLAVLVRTLAFEVEQIEREAVR